MENLILVLLGLGWAIYTAMKKSAARSAQSRVSEGGSISGESVKQKPRSANGFSDFTDILDKIANQEFGFEVENEKKESLPVVEPAQPISQKSHLENRFNRAGSMPGDLASSRVIADEVIPDSLIQSVNPTYKSIEYEVRTEKKKPIGASSSIVDKEDEELPNFEFELRNAILSQVILERKFF